MSSMLKAGMAPDWYSRVPAANGHKILVYVGTKWTTYCEAYAHTEPPFQERSEPELTKGFGHFLVNEKEAGRQTIPGRFYVENQHFILRSNGMAICIARTDIEWNLDGFPPYVIEFKILSGARWRRARYIRKGLFNFVEGRYAPKAPSAAMWAFLRRTAADDYAEIHAAIRAQAAVLRCDPRTDPIVVPSVVAPAVAAFDTAHQRDDPAVSPIDIAHVFSPLP
jgi:hypothetical protein